ncbi:hypothetical protein C8J57DRAFT_1223736 [Mycena rebaudengoi]|nr:hypothetical protein C8J57DRAFT_1223736 [Mycena rebaudengoi]
MSHSAVITAGSSCCRPVTSQAEAIDMRDTDSECGVQLVHLFFALMLLAIAGLTGISNFQGHSARHNHPHFQFYRSSYLGNLSLIPMQENSAATELCHWPTVLPCFFKINGVETNNTGVLVAAESTAAAEIVPQPNWGIPGSINDYGSTFYSPVYVQHVAVHYSFHLWDDSSPESVATKTACFMAAATINHSLVVVGDMERFCLKLLLHIFIMTMAWKI